VRAYELMRQITDEDLALLWMQSTFGRPEGLIMFAVPVPPVPIRPSVPQDMGGGSTEDDLTVKLQEIVEMNNALKMALEKGATMKMIAEDWEYLQIQVQLDSSMGWRLGVQSTAWAFVCCASVCSTLVCFTSL
jgi:DNA-directed RNA polymerase III subunit RPC1